VNSVTAIDTATNTLVVGNGHLRGGVLNPLHGSVIEQQLPARGISEP